MRFTYELLWAQAISPSSSVLRSHSGQSWRSNVIFVERGPADPRVPLEIAVATTSSPSATYAWIPNSTSTARPRGRGDRGHQGDDQPPETVTDEVPATAAGNYTRSG